MVVSLREGKAQPRCLMGDQADASGNATAGFPDEFDGGSTARTIAVLCTLGAFAVHKSKRTPTDATTLLEDLWGLRFRPYDVPQEALVAFLGCLGLLALCAQAFQELGVGILVFIMGLVVIVLRAYGIFGALRCWAARGAPKVALRTLWRRLLACGGGRTEEVEEAQDEDTVVTGAAPLPVWVITGFLGSGKTTLVNRLVKSRVLHLLVVTNEAGETALDAELILEAAHSPESVLLVNGGCACCKVRGDLCDMMRDQVLCGGKGGGVRGGAEGVVLECSGLADPRAVAQTFLLDDDLRRRLELREVIAVVDAAHVGKYIGRSTTGTTPTSSAAGAKEESRSPLTRIVEEQIAFASLVLLNKADCASEEQLASLTRAITEINEVVEVMPCTYCDVEVSQVLRRHSGFHFARPGWPVGAWSPDRALLEIENISVYIGGRNTSQPATSMATGDAVRCISLRVDGELDLDAFNRWALTVLKDFTILRAKGVLAAKGYRQKLAFQAVHAAFHGTPTLKSRWQANEARYSQIVVIGCDLQPDLLEYGLRRCLKNN